MLANTSRCRACDPISSDMYIPRHLLKCAACQLSVDAMCLKYKTITSWQVVYLCCDCRSWG